MQGRQFRGPIQDRIQYYIIILCAHQVTRLIKEALYLAGLVPKDLKYLVHFIASAFMAMYFQK